MYKYIFDNKSNIFCALKDTTHYTPKRQKNIRFQRFDAMCQQFETALFAPILLALPTLPAISKARHVVCRPRRGAVTLGMDVESRRQVVGQWGGMIQGGLVVSLLIL
jgi:hypothetical protein